MSELCCKFSGGDNALLISLEAAFDRGIGAKIVAQGEKLGGICVVCWRGWVWGEVFTQFKKRKMKLPCSVLQNHISYCQPYPSHCNNVTSKSHIDINWTLIMNDCRTKDASFSFRFSQLKNPKSVTYPYWCLIFLDPNFQKPELQKMSDTFLCLCTHSITEGF